MTARLTSEKVVERARGFGFELVSPYEQYESNETVLTWRCNGHQRHVVEMTLGHLRRGCGVCRQDSRDTQRRYAEFDAVADMVLERGDVLLSGPGGYINRSSLISFACSMCGEEASQTAAKIKKGQRHACQQMAAAQGKRRQEAYDAVKAELRLGGIELLTPVTEYGGLRSIVSYKLCGAQESGEATVLRLQRMAAKKVAAKAGL
jgi:hypothetical protein